MKIAFLDRNGTIEDEVWGNVEEPSSSLQNKGTPTQ